MCRNGFLFWNGWCSRGTVIQKALDLVNVLWIVNSFAVIMLWETFSLNPTTSLWRWRSNFSYFVSLPSTGLVANIQLVAYFSLCSWYWSKAVIKVLVIAYGQIVVVKCVSSFIVLQLLGLIIFGCYAENGLS